MSQSNGSKQHQSLCGKRGCSGSSCDICEAICASLDVQARITCPHGVSSCCVDNRCDKCIVDQYPKHKQPQPRGRGADGSRSALDVVPLQDFKVEQSGPICENCQKLEGSKQKCQICAVFHESAKTARNGDQNPDVPRSVVFQENLGPRREDLCALTPEEVRKSVDLLRGVFLSMVLPLIPVESRVLDSHVGLWRGCEWSSGNCWLVAILQMFQTGSWHTSINVSNALGNALWILVHELRTIRFVPRQKLQAFRRLMQEIIGQHERGTLFENGQMDPLEVLKMLEKNGVFRYDYCFSSDSFIQGIHATPVIDLGLSPSSSTILVEKIDNLGVEIIFVQDSDFSCLPSAIVIKVSSSELVSGSTVDFPASSVFDLGPLTFQITSVLLFINGHYLTVFISLRYDPQTETVYTTYWLSDSKSDVQDCGHHVPSIVEINQIRFDKLWRDHAISITCSRIPNILQIDRIPHELNGTDFEPLKPAWESLPECDKGQYTTFGPNGEILIKNCMSQLEFQLTFSPRPLATSAQVAQPLKHMNAHLTQNNITVSGEKWSCNDRDFSGKVEKMPHPKYPHVMMEVYFYKSVSKTTLRELVDFLNFIESIQ